MARGFADWWPILEVAPSYFGELVYSGDATNPAAGTIIVDTGGISQSICDIFFFMGSSVALTLNDLVFQWRNSANTANRFAHSLFCSGAFSYNGKILGAQVTLGERFRIISINGKTGILYGGIIAVARKLL